MTADTHGPVDVHSHAQLVAQGARAAAVLAELGVGPGDRVAVALPMGLESVIITLACVRLEARRVGLPLDSDPAALVRRLRPSEASLVITADHCRVDGALVAVKAGLDRALRDCPAVGVVLVVPHLPRPVPWSPGRDRWWPDELEAATPTGRAYAEAMAEHPSSAGPAPRDPTAALIFDDPLAGEAADDRGEGWGDPPAEDGGAAELRRLLEEKPPHHL